MNVSGDVFQLLYQDKSAKMHRVNMTYCDPQDGKDIYNGYSSSGISKYEQQNYYKVHPEAESETENQKPDNGNLYAEYGIRKFWLLADKGGQRNVELKIDHYEFINYIYDLGYRRYDVNNDFIFILLTGKIIDQVSITQIQDHIIRKIKELPDEFWEKEGTRQSQILTKLHAAPTVYFSKQKFSLIEPEKNLILNRDTRDKCFIYYRNGFVECTAEGYTFKPYSELENYVFRKQIKDRDFSVVSEEGYFWQYFTNITRNENGVDEERYYALRSMVGYLMHSFFDTKMKSVNLTDSDISENAEGRTGKTLLGRAISHIKSLCEISGKDFDPANKHKYSEVDLDTQIVFLNDLRKNFRFESLFNDISDHFTVDKKNQHPFPIKAKMLISSNDTLRTEGASAKDRVIEFEFSNYYHLNFGPNDEFGHFFFSEWNGEEWSRFDNFMVGCISLYLAKGILEVKPINLTKRKQIQHTNPDFVEFIDSLLAGGELVREKWYHKKELFDQFIEQYPEYKDDRWLKSLRNFTKYLKIYASNSEVLKGYQLERKSNGQSMIMFSQYKCEKDIPSISDKPGSKEQTIPF